MIVTTRRGGFAAMGQVLDLDVIGLAAAVRMLRARVPGLAQQTGEQIADELGRLPLALEQAAAWLDRSQMPAQEYLELLRSRGADLYARGQVADRSETIATLWQISVGRITAENPAAVQLLGVCAYLAPEPIPLDLFTAHANLLPEPLRPPPPTRWPSPTPSRSWSITPWPTDPGRAPAAPPRPATIRARDHPPHPRPRTRHEKLLPMADDQPRAGRGFAGGGGAAAARRCARPDHGCPAGLAAVGGAAAACPGRHRPR